MIDPVKIDTDIKPDIVAVTHLHYDHYDRNYINSLECRKSIAEVGSFTYKDVKVTGIAASHHGDAIKTKDPDNVIYIIETDGLRIVHFGDTGQNLLSSGQVLGIGNVDVAMMQFVNPNSGYTLENRKGIGILKQVNPGIVIPTHAFAFKNVSVGKKSFLLPAHGVGKTLKHLKQELGRTEKHEYLILNKEDLSNAPAKAVWFNKTLAWKDINS